MIGLVNQLCNLERRVSRAGKDSISHPDGDTYHDDLANACAGAADCVTQPVQEQASTAIYSHVVYCDEQKPSKTRLRLEREMADAVPGCTIDFNDPKNQWHGPGFRAPGFEDYET